MTEQELRKQIIEQRIAYQSGLNGREIVFTDAGMDNVMALIQASQAEAVKAELERLREQSREVTAPNAFVNDSGVAQSIRIHTNSLIEHRIAQLTAEEGTK
jgi:hypothetical protein